MELQWKGKWAVVTAASRGIGFAIADKLAEEGANLIVCSRHRESIDEAAASLKKHGTEVIARAVDVSDAGSLQAFVKEVAAERESIDALVCNAGGPPGGGFLSFDDEAWEKAFATNVMSVVRLVRGFYPLLKQQGGRIVTIASTSVKEPIPGLVLSNTMRTGVTGLMKTLSVELGPDGILVNTVCPGRIETDRIQELDRARAEREGRSEEEIRKAMEAQIPLGRYGRPEELADLAAFLLSPRNTYLTGSTYFVDGGMVKSL
ncbi:short-chain dehydrogenase [Paenibacillus sp. J31TS4]|uniref:SDR family oxidoreductase n=1 Tax=Paenibacillus sp. J31TS4 TaxID=2807195 RepID=UPI001B0A128C|nr:SDR family oxidoreductase [Paenibacillus sp. J31TS4]GIP39786.1 short-chain dehydrogenase [Paenibacillus sp. J31TS4]